MVGVTIDVRTVLRRSFVQEERATGSSECSAARSQQFGALPQGEGAMLEPQGGFSGKALGGELLVPTKLRLTELGAPPPVRPLVEECGRTVGKAFVQDLRCFML